MIDKSKTQIKNDLGIQIQENSDQLKIIQKNLDQFKTILDQSQIQMNNELGVQIQENLNQLKTIQQAQNLQIGDVLITSRDLSANDKWINCINSRIDLSNYPELREMHLLYKRS